MTLQERIKGMILSPYLPFGDRGLEEAYRRIATKTGCNPGTIRNYATGAKDAPWALKLCVFIFEYLTKKK